MPRTTLFRPTQRKQGGVPKEIKAKSNRRYYLFISAITVSGKVKFHIIFVLPSALSRAKSYMPTVRSKLAKLDIATTFLL